MKRTFQKIICIATAMAMIGCATTHEYAQSSDIPSQSTITLPPCTVDPLYGARPLEGSSHWSGNCGVDGAMGEGLAVWGTQGHLQARYVGKVEAGIPNGPGANFFDGKIRFEGVVKDGKAFLGTWTDANGQFKGRFDDSGNFDQGMLRKPDGTVIAGRFAGHSPIGTFVVRDPNGKLWYGEMIRGQIVKRAPIVKSDTSSLAALGIVAVVGGLAMAFFATGALIVGVAAVAAVTATPAAGVIIVIL